MRELSQAAQDVIAERHRQIEQEGWSPDHDDRYKGRELGKAARHYVTHASDADRIREQYTHVPPPGWPWDHGWWRPSSRRRDLVKAGALILAEIERLDRMEGNS